MKLVTSNNINGRVLDEDAIGKPIIINSLPIGYISGISGGDGYEDSTGNPLWVEIEIWDCGWSVVRDEDEEFVGLNYSYPYHNVAYEEEED